MAISMFLTRPAALIALLGVLPQPLPAADQDPRRRLWPELYESSKKEWVDYCDTSRVDFEKGRFEVQALVPVPGSEPGDGGGARYGELDETQWAAVKAAAQEKVSKQVERMLLKAEPGKPPLMNDQIMDPDHKFMVEAQHAARFTAHHLIPQMVVDDKPVVGTDKKPRLRVKVQFDLVPDHIMVRARRYKAKIEECAKRFDIDRTLLYALIHSESNFNPMCTSAVGARGLMQLMPEAASEADKFLNKRKTERPISPEQLYAADTSILLGSAYLHMLKVRYFGEFKNVQNRRALSVAAYNCGPWYVKRRITPKADFEKLSAEEAVALIRKYAPRETRYYVPRVLKRMALYQDI